MCAEGRPHWAWGGGGGKSQDGQRVRRGFFDGCRVRFLFDLIALAVGPPPPFDEFSVREAFLKWGKMRQSPKSGARPGVGAPSPMARGAHAWANTTSVDLED